MKEKVLKTLNEQMNAEYYSAYLYLGMSAYADRAGFKGTAGWLLRQAHEEREHAEKIFKFILERGDAPAFADIKATPPEYKSPEEVFKKVAAHERHVTDLIDAAATVALDERDHAAYSFLRWFVDEQVEEVSTADDILAKFTAVGNNPGLLFSLDAVLGQRQ
ncbi:MAG: ferritin [Synergistaceae bacterium]|jgi:ferritin|nr:ferritin [Synergistaceae bacterium]